MENIAKELLKLKFPNVSLFALTEVIEATPNPKLAIEILCGIDEEVIVPPMVESDNGKVFSLLKFDKWTNTVEYSYLQDKVKYGWVPPTVKDEDINLENFDSLKCGMSTKDSRYFELPTGKTVFTTYTMDLKSWNKLKPINN